MSIDDELIDRILDGEPSDAEVAEVLRWLDLPGNLGQFALRVEMHADLRRSLRRRKIQAESLPTGGEFLGVAPDSEARSNHSRSLVRRRLFVGIAALVAALALTLSLDPWKRHRAPGAPSSRTAAIVREVDAVLTTRGGRRWSGAELLAGEYRLEQGLLNLRFDNGVLVFLEAPTHFEAVSGKRLVLHAGRLSVTVPLEGIGFAVATPEADIVDFGTEFSVDARTGASEVHVFQGLVRVHPRARIGAPAGEPVDLETSQAIVIDETVGKPVEIDLATHGFIRSFDEPQRKFCRAVKDLKPAAYYRMPISRGFPCEPPEYGGDLLGDRNRVPRAPGFLGGALLVGGRSAGRGAVVSTPPVLNAGRLSITAHVYLEKPTDGSTIVTNFDGDQGNFALTVDELGRPRATVRPRGGGLITCSGDDPLPTRRWCHLVMTADGDHIRLFVDGERVWIEKCPAIAAGESQPIWFGTDRGVRAFWDGRIDELAFFERSLSRDEVQELHAAVLDTIRMKRQSN
ncbi:MAG: LamG-like jellyroll fold domain-containing protein [Isosphaeraceae bacterium]|nr:LamG-like jellyroll fold domain-containing protein [Isosphaeraceae bacterium]